MSATPESTDDEVGEEEDEEAVRRIVDRRRSSVSELSLQKVDWNLKVKVLKEPSPKTSKVAKWSKRLKGRRDKANSLKDKRLSIIPEAFASHNNNNGAPTGVRAAIPGSPSSFLQSAKRRLSAASHLSVLSASSQSASAGKWSSSEAPDASNMLDERLKAKTKALEKNKKGSKDETEGKEKEKENDAEERGGGGDQATILQQGENAVRK